MPLTYYKPSKSNNGYGIGLEFNSKEQSLFATIIRQTGPGDANGKGAFQNGDKLNIKLSATEVAAIIRVAESVTNPQLSNDKATLLPTPASVKLYHEAASQTVKLDIAVYQKDSVVKGLTFSAFRSKIVDGTKEEGEKFGFFFNLDETVLFREYCKFVLTHFFTAIYSEDKKRRDEAFKKKQAGEKTPKKSEPPAEPAPETEEDVF